MYKVYESTPGSYGYYGSALISAENAEEANEFIKEFKKNDENNTSDSLGYSYVKEYDNIEHLFSDVKGIIKYGIYYNG